MFLIKKNKIFFSAITLVAFVAVSGYFFYSIMSPKVVDKADVVIDRKNGDRTYKNRSFTGEAIGYYSSGQVASAEQFVDGRRHGHLKQWFDSGVLSYEAYYKVGRREGASTSWWSNGNIRSKSHFVDDKLDGESLSWYNSGERFKKANLVAGEYVGLQQGWRKNGKLFSNFEYKNGRVYGLRNSNLCFELKDETISLNQTPRVDEKQIY